MRFIVVVRHGADIGHGMVDGLSAAGRRQMDRLGHRLRRLPLGEAVILHGPRPEMHTSARLLSLYVGPACIESETLVRTFGDYTAPTAVLAVVDHYLSYHSIVMVTSDELAGLVPTALAIRDWTHRTPIQPLHLGEAWLLDYRQQRLIRFKRD